MNKGNKKQLKLSIFEIVWYTLCLLVAIWGITYIVLGLLGMYLPIRSEDNVLKQASLSYAKTFGLGFFEYGLIHLAVAAVASIIVLCIQSKKSDRDVEKAQRRAAIRASARQLSQEEEPLDLTQDNELPAPEAEEEEIQVQVQVEEEPQEAPQEEQPQEEPVQEEPAPEETPQAEEEKKEEPQE